LRPGAGQAGAHALLDATALELGDGSEDVHLELSRGRGGVDALGETHKRDAERLKLLEEGNQVFQVSPETVQPPTDEDIEPSPLGVRDETVGCRPPILRAADAAVDVFDS